MALRKKKKKAEPEKGQDQSIRKPLLPQGELNQDLKKHPKFSKFKKGEK